MVTMIIEPLHLWSSSHAEWGNGAGRMQRHSFVVSYPRAEAH